MITAFPFLLGVAIVAEVSFSAVGVGNTSVEHCAWLVTTWKTWLQVGERGASVSGS